MNKKIMLLTAVFALTILLSACGNNSTSEANGKVTLTLFSTMSNSGERKAFEEVIRAFEKEHPHLRIDANFPGNSYEDTIRVKMGEMICQICLTHMAGQNSAIASMSLI